MFKNKNKGFTLIELLVVIAIISLLSSIVLASLKTARSKAADAAVKSQMNSVRPQAEIFYGIGQTYTGVCADSQIVKLLDAASMSGAGNTTSDICYIATAPVGQGYAAIAEMKTQNLFGETSSIDYWCVDSTGQSKLINNPLGVGVWVCP